MRRKPHRDTYIKGGIIISYRVCVYAICKNESQFVDRFMDSMSEADDICVLDTGSTDDTVEKLRARGAHVEQKVISPWRFDVARNKSLKLIPKDADICCCIDLDEQFQSGWREKLERAWQPDTTRARYRYTWSFLPDGREGCVFWTGQNSQKRLLPLGKSGARGSSIHWARAASALSTPRACSSTTTPTRANRAGSICHF